MFLSMLIQQIPAPSQELYYFAAFITAVIGFYMSESIRKKNYAEAADSLTSAAMKLSDEKDRQISSLKEELTLRNLYIEYLLAGGKVLRLQLKEEPNFIPKSIDSFR